MNKLSKHHIIAIGFISAAAILSSKSNNRYCIGDAIREAAECLAALDDDYGEDPEPD